MQIKDLEIPDYGILKISEYGDVWGKHDYTKKRKLETDEDGYFRVGVKYDKPHKKENGDIVKSSKIFVHRLVAMAFIPNPHNYPIINHIDGNKQNNHYTNLEWGTVKYNNQHAFETGLYKGICGENNPKNKISREDVLHIRDLYEKSDKKRL